MTNDSGGHHETLSNSLNIQAFPATLLYENFSDDIDQDPPHIQGPLHAASQETEEYEWRPESVYMPHYRRHNAYQIVILPMRTSSSHTSRRSITRYPNSHIKSPMMSQSIQFFCHKTATR
jgi:hypothetical protein